MKEKLRVAKSYVLDNLELVLVPVIFLLLLTGINFVWHYFQLPSQDDLNAKIQGFFLTYGLWVIFISSVIESMLFLGWYFPGSLVIFLGVAATQGNPEQAIKTVICVITGMTLGYTVNYFLGMFGWYKVLVKFGFKSELLKIEKMIREKGMLHSFFLYIMPGFGCLLSTAFGVLQFTFLRFLSFTLLFVVFWDSIWGVLVYHFGMPLFKLLTNNIVMFIIFCVYFKF